MLASTIQFTNTPPNPGPHENHQTPPRLRAAGDVIPRPEPGTEKQPTRAVPSGPNSVPPDHTHPHAPSAGTSQPASTTFPPMSTATTHSVVQRPLAPTAPLQDHDGGKLLRKEVIQPHLPVRLPCYDFVPIASPTFDHSLPQGVGPWASCTRPGNVFTAALLICDY
jgi:hypothetical protein